MEGCLTFFIFISYAKGNSLGVVGSYSHSEGVALHKAMDDAHTNCSIEAAMNSWNVLQTTKTPWKFLILHLLVLEKHPKAFRVAKFDYIFLRSITSFGYIQKCPKKILECPT
jgi:hypothetical protein